MKTTPDIEDQNPAVSSSELLNRLIDVEAARQEFGEPQYGFGKRYVQYSSGRRRGAGQHFSGSWVEVTQEEFDANYEASLQTELKRFMRGANGRDGFKESYWRYEKRLVSPGWPQKLCELLESV